MVLREGMRLVVFGLAGGLVAAFAASRVLSGLLYGVAPQDGVSFALASAGLIVVALVATYVPRGGRRRLIRSVRCARNDVRRGRL